MRPRGRSARSSRALCRPPPDRPTATEATTLADCASEILYFGIGRPADTKAARLCAFVEKKNADPQVEDFGFTGDRTLMMVYANGLGADRNLDLATALACRIDGAPAEVDGRVKHLAKLKADGWTGHDFSLCDDVTSGLLTGICADHDQRVAKAGRDAARRKLTADWTPEQRALLQPLDRAAAAFADARGENEVDQSGTARGAFVVGAEEKQDKSFAGLLADVDAGKLAPASPADRAAADAALNMKYRDVIRRAPSLFADSTVSTAGVASAEKAWIRYRDAWLRLRQGPLSRALARRAGDAAHAGPDGAVGGCAGSAGMRRRDRGYASRAPGGRDAAPPIVSLTPSRPNDLP